MRKKTKKFWLKVIYSLASGYILGLLMFLYQIMAYGNMNQDPLYLYLYRPLFFSIIFFIFSLIMPK